MILFADTSDHILEPASDARIANSYGAIGGICTSETELNFTFGLVRESEHMNVQSLV